VTFTADLLTLEAENVANYCHVPQHAMWHLTVPITCTHLYGN